MATTDDFWQRLRQIPQPSRDFWQKVWETQYQMFQHLCVTWQPLLEDLQRVSSQLATGTSGPAEPKAGGRHQNFDKNWMQPLQDMALTDLVQSYQSYQKLVEASVKHLGHAPLPLFDCWQMILTEYRKYLDIVPRQTKHIDIQHVAQIWNKIVSGPWDEDVKKYVQRFTASLRVKLKYGPEYYADPETTRVGLTPKEVVWQQGHWKLYRYDARPEAAGRPLLIVYSLINRPYILDLQPGASLIEYLLCRGLPVYLLDWGEPDASDRQLTLDGLLEPGLDDAVTFLCRQNGIRQVSLFGHCLGGVLALLYSALHPEKVARLLTLTTPVTSKNRGIIDAWANLMPIDGIIDAFGNMPGKLIRYSFIAMKPYYEIMRWHRYYTALGKNDDTTMAAVHAVDKWVNDNVDVPGAVFRTFLKIIYQEDSLCQGKTLIHGKRADLANITCPLLNIVCADDWIVPQSSASFLNELVGSKEKTLRKIPGQHLSIFLEERNRPVWGEIANFFGG